MKTVYLFTLLKCRYCDEVRDKLTDDKVPFTEIRIEENREIWEKVKQQVGGRCLLPSVFIQDRPDGGGTAYIAARDFRSPDEIVSIIKNRLSDQ